MMDKRPLNWCKCNLKEIFSTASGGTPSRKEASYYNGQIPWLKSGELNDNIVKKAEEFITKEGLDNSSAKIFPKGSILLALYGATVGKIGKLDFEAATNQAICCIYPSKFFNMNLLFYYLLFQKKFLISQGKGGTQPNISQDIVKNLELFLPPLEEQGRIVEKIEELFSDIDNGIEDLKIAQAQIKQYRQSVLKSAFEGKLYKTSKWKEVKLEDVCKFKSGTTIPKDLEHINGDIPYVKVADMNLPDNRVEICTSSKFGILSELRESQIIPIGAVIFPKRGGAIATNKKRKVIKPIIIDLNIMAIIPSEKINQNFLFYKMLSIDLTKLSNGGNIPQINNYSFDNEKILLPSLPEQQQIVAEIEKRFAVADEMEKAVNDSLLQAEKLKQSILKHAFAGKLVPQNPNDESAAVLLERIKAAKENSTKGKK